METKRTHFKMYKSGRRWVFACAVLLMTLGAGTTVTANAATTDSSSGNTVETSSSATSQSSGSDVNGEASSDAVSSDAVSSDATSTTESKQADSQSSVQTSNTKSQDVQSVKATRTTGLRAGKTVEAAKLAEKQSVQPRLNKRAIKKTVTRATKVNTKTYLHVNTNAAKAAVASLNKGQTITTVSQLLKRLAGPATPASAITPLETVGVQAGGSVYDDFPDLNNILGVSSAFHIFARDAELNAHTNGNIAVQNLTGNVNFGTNIIEELLDKDISYIQNIDKIANSSFVSAGDTRENKVVFGSGIEIDLSNPNRPMVNGEYIDHLLASEVYQDQNGQTYIDFDAEFAKLKALNETLANQSSEASFSNSDFADQNNRVIDVSELTPNANNQIVINLSPDVLQSDTPLTIAGLSPDADGTTVIINVDTGTDADYDVNSQIKIVYADGSSRDPHETEDFGDNHLLWNFYNSGASDKQYTGTLDFKKAFQGSILAPSATVVASSNIDGNIIADKVIVNAETHRWDLQDNKDNEEDFEVPVHPGIDVEMPEFPGVDVPDPDKPDPENPEPETPDPEPENPEPETPGTEEPNTVDPDEGGEEDLTYEHEHPEYTEDLAEEFEDDLIDFEESANTPAEETLLNKVDAAISAAEAKGDTELVNQLTSVRGNILRALGLSDGLPQTGEANQNWLSIAGFVLAGTLLTTGVVVDRKRRY